MGFFDLLNARDLYRSAYDEKGMNRYMFQLLALLLPTVCSLLVFDAGLVLAADWSSASSTPCC